MTFIPEQMIILKGTFPKIYESPVISSLQKIGLTEFIDVEAKAHTSARKLTDERKRIYEVRERLSFAVRTLRADYEETMIPQGERIKLDGDSLETTLNLQKKS